MNVKDLAEAPMKTLPRPTTSSRAVAALLQIMRDTEQGVRRRIQACEHLLDYECPPEVIDEAKAALMSIVEDGETHVDTKLDSLKLLRRVEARRVSPGRATREQDVEISRALEVLRRRKALIKAGVSPPFPDGYADDLAGEDYVPAPADPEPVADLAVAPRKAQLRPRASGRRRTH
jgi:hypothetical protein